MKKYTYLSLATFIAAIIVHVGLFNVPLVYAGTGLKIQPIKVSQTILPGAQASGVIQLTNAGDQDVYVDISVQDFIPQSGGDTVQFISRAAGVTTVKDWIKLKSPDHFLFKKDSTVAVPYTITATKNAEPGSHFGVMFFKATNAADVNAEIKVGTQVGVLVFVTVPGNYKQTGRILNFTAPHFIQGGPVPFEFTFENTGTVHFEPRGTIKISNMFGKQVGEVPIEGYVILPTGVRKMNFTWETSGLLVGRYSATASVVDGAGKVLSSNTVSFYSFPIKLLLLFILTILILFFIIKFIKSKISFNITVKR